MHFDSLQTDNLHQSMLQRLSYSKCKGKIRIAATSISNFFDVLQCTMQVMNNHIISADNLSFNIANYILL